MKVNRKELHNIFIGIRKHEKKEFDKLYENYKTLIYGVAFSILKNKEDSEEIVQTVFMKIFKLAQDKLPNKNEASWLYTLTKNETICYLRTKRENINIEDIYEIEDECKDIDDTINKIQYNELIRKLNNMEREIISLKVLSDCSFSEIAKMLNKPVGTVKWKYYKAINTLKITLSNLAMFLITFIIGVNTIKKQSTKPKQETNIEHTTIEEQKNNTEDEGQLNNTNREEQKDNMKYDNTLDSPENDQESIEDQTTNSVKDITNETEQATTIQENTPNVNQYVGISMLSISAIFLILTIIFSTFLVKYQLNNHSKSSK